MPHPLDNFNPRSALVEIARDFHRRGWMAGTAGNLSARDPLHTTSFWITASGLAKGRLRDDDFLRIDINDERVVERFYDGAKPSAETAIHRVIYQLFPEVNACLHIHSVDACVTSARYTVDCSELPLPPLEMLKGLGVWEEQPVTALPLFNNWSDVPAIAAAIRQRLMATPEPLPALMIHGHGTTVWGNSLQEAYNRIEIVEFFMSYLALHPYP
jgi:methylthioribulose-1-phosphate dehydratase